MNIIVVGVGKLGSKIAENLAEEGHDITVVDINEEAIDRVCNSADIMGIVGNGIDYKTLDDAQIRDADMLIAMTGSDELNILLCVVANERKSHSAQQNFQTVARVVDPIIKKDQRTFIREKLGISNIINPRYEVAKEISNYILNPSADEVDYFAKDKIELLSAKLPQNSPLVDKSIQQIFQKSESFLVCAIERNGSVIVPSGSDMLLAGDKITFATSNKNAGLFFKRANINNDNIKRVIIMGGGSLSYYLAKRLENFGVKIKIIEKDQKRCEFLDENLDHHVRIVNGDGTDRLLLEEENISHYDAFVAATGIDETNLMMSIFVSQRYHIKTITKVNRLQFADTTDMFNIGNIIYPTRVISERIGSFVSSISNAEGSNVQSIASIVGGKAFAIEFHINQESSIIGKTLSQLNIRDDVILCCISRNNKFLIPGGNDFLQADDDVVVVTKDKNMSNINDILKH